MLRALRDGCGLTQDRWAAFVGVSRKSVQRWEAGQAVPDANAEAAIVDLCRERRVFSSSFQGAAHGLPPTALTEALTSARVGRPDRGTLSVPDRNQAACEAGVVGDLLGRADDLARLREAFGVSRLVTLTGPGGVGKTALATSFAATKAAESGTVFVAVAPIGQAALVPVVIASAVGVRQAGSSTLRDALVAALAGRSETLVIDNFEHVIDSAPLVAELLASCPTLRVLATSRQPLGLPGEHEMALEALEVGDAVALGQRRGSRSPAHRSQPAPRAQGDVGRPRQPSNRPPAGH
jgi:DNA-binding XRE family transcriptional regulator